MAVRFKRAKGEKKRALQERNKQTMEVECVDLTDDSVADDVEKNSLASQGVDAGSLDENTGPRGKADAASNLSEAAPEVEIDEHASTPRPAVAKAHNKVFKTPSKDDSANSADPDHAPGKPSGSSSPSKLAAIIAASKDKRQSMSANSTVDRHAASKGDTPLRNSFFKSAPAGVSKNPDNELGFSDHNRDRGFDQTSHFKRQCRDQMQQEGLMD